MKQSSMLMACMCLCVAMAARGQSVAVVDMEELVKSHPNTISDKKLLEQTLKDFRVENDELRQKLEAMQDDFEKIRKEAQDPALSEKARKTAEERAGKAREALIASDRTAREKMQSRQEQFNDMQMRMRKKTVGELREVIGKFAEEKKITLVLFAEATVYNEKSMNITDAILKQLNVQPAPRVTEEAAKPSPLKVKDAPAPATPK
ncbi:MAG: OmpH family outer membrane protein [Kiritimatiellia bacterium]